MTRAPARTKFARGSCSNSCTRAQDPNLSRKAGSIVSILPHLAARLRHPRRSRFDALMDGLRREAPTGCPAPRPHAVISAATRRSDEAACEALAARLWTTAEREAFRSLTAGGGVS